MKKWILISIIVLTLFMVNETTFAMNLKDYSFLKIAVIENGTNYEWEYENPDKFEYEVGEKVIKDERAKQQFIEMIKRLQFQKDADVEQMVERLKQSRFPNIEKLDIRLMDHKGKLMTWIWHQSNDTSRIAR